MWKLFESIRLIRDYILIRKSKFFDKEWYLRTYPDVRESRVNPYLHFLKRGGFEGRNPSRFFNTIEYSNNSGYSKTWQMNPLVHYLLIGNKQGVTRGVSQDVLTRAVEEPQEMSPEDQSITDIQTRISMDKLLTDEEWTKKHFWLQFNRDLDLENPKTLNEKISVYKLLYREKPLWRFADKYAVRDHIKERLGERYLIPLIGVYEHVDDIDFDALPDRFIVKPNHGSGWFIACQDRNVFDREKCKKLCASWLKINFYDVNREWAYKQIPPKIIIEELLIESPDRTSKDYKLYCFNGKPAYINVIADRFGEKTLQDFDVNWNKVPFKAITPGPKQDEERPENLQELLDIATNLSGDFPFVRVDLYARPKVYFGEFTFYPGAGLTPFGDARKDLLYGSCLDMRPIYESKQVYT